MMLISRQEDPDSTQTPCLVTKSLVIVSVIFPLLSLVATVLRFKARGVSRTKLQADDWWMVASWIIAFFLSINVWVFSSLTGIDFYKIDVLTGTTYSLQCLYVASILVVPALTSVKIAILLFYKRIFLTYKFKVAVWILIAILVPWCIVFMLLTALQGDPLDSPWKLTGTFRYDIAAVGYAQVGSSIALDFLVLCYPLPVISRLHMALTRKISVALIFWLGIFCCIASIVRVVFLVQLLSTVVEAKSAIAIQSKQFVFLVLEPHCSIIAGCLPCYGPLLAGIGGRAPESIVRSVRSMISLGSWRSGGSRGSKTKAGKSDGVQSADPKDIETRGESQVELSDRSQWPDASHDVYISRGSVKSNSPKHSHDGSIPRNTAPEAINVTRGVDVSYA